MISAVDTNILSCLWSGSAESERAYELLNGASRAGRLIVCSVVYAELMANPAADAEFVDGFLEKARMDVDFNLERRLCREAGARFRAHAKRRQRSRSEKPRRIVADFLIGMHALLHADRLITFDGDGYRRDFPELVLLP